jgi:hypothetical protein
LRSASRSLSDVIDMDRVYQESIGVSNARFLGKRAQPDAI